MLTVALWALSIIAALAGGYLVGRAGRHTCLVCHRPLPRVCAGGRCAETPHQPIGHEEYPPDEDVAEAQIRHAVADLEHPSWCNRYRCAERGYHASTPVRCNADQGAERIEHRVTAPGDRGSAGRATELLIVRVSLRQHIGLEPVYVEIDTYDRPEDEHTGLVMTPLQGRLVAAGIKHLLRAGGDAL